MGKDGAPIHPILIREEYDGAKKYQKEASNGQPENAL